MLDPAGPRQDLPVLKLMAAPFYAVVVENHAAGAGGALVDRSDEFGHVRSSRDPVHHGLRGHASPLHQPKLRPASTLTEEGQARGGGDEVDAKEVVDITNRTVDVVNAELKNPGV